MGGDILKPGNHVLGYDVRAVNMPGAESNQVDQRDHPDVILVRKLFQKRKGKRQWELRRLDRTKEDGEEQVNDDNDMEALRQDLGLDPELRKGINMYRVDEPKPRASAT